MSKKLCRFLFLSLCLASLLVVCAFATGDGGDTSVTASTVISTMGTSMGTVKQDVLNALNVVVPAGLGVSGVTYAVRIGKKMFKVSGGNGN